VRAVSLHPDVLVVTSAVLHVNCVIVRGRNAGGGRAGEGTPARAGGGWAGESTPARAVYSHGYTVEQEDRGETFVIDSPVLPDELDALPALLEQAQFPSPSGLLATHSDWDHLLGRLAFPGVALGCAESTAERLGAAPGAAQRELRAFDEDLLIERQRPLALGAIQALPVPGRCEIGRSELELYPAIGHTLDGMAIWIPWARVLVAGDYLSTLELAMLGDGGAVVSYIATLERLRPLVAASAHVVPGHGPVLDRTTALALLEDDIGYMRSLAEHGADAALPGRAHNKLQRAIHAQNLTQIAG
jgi:glyoxylase-like metal-dependent hydrolase (beta-lactamase superfamily II)